MAPGADALKTAEAVKAEIARVAKGFPPGLKIAYANDTTDLIKLSIDEVVKTFPEDWYEKDEKQIGRAHV